MIKINEKCIEEIQVSVIIPVYNVLKYLSKCLDSIVSQSYRNIEIIIIDDGSTDGCSSVCDEYAQNDKRIHLMHTDNKGLSAARNLGINNANGSFLLFVDSDDWIEENTIEVMVYHAVAWDADIVTAEVCSEFVGKSIVTSKSTGITTICGKSILDGYINGLFGDMVWNKLYRTSCFSDIRFPNRRNAEDLAITWIMMTNLAENNGTIVCLPNHLYHYRRRKSGISNTWSLQNIVDFWKANKERYEGMSEYTDCYLRSCFTVIGMMCISYPNFSIEDKLHVPDIIHEMHLFSKKYYKCVILNHFPNRTKCICMLSRFQLLTPGLMYAASLLYKLKKLMAASIKNNNTMYE